MKSGHITGVAWADANGQGYLPLAHPETDCMDATAVSQWLRSLFKTPGKEFIFHNAPYDLGWLRVAWGIEPPPIIHDTTAMAVMVDENRYSYRLDDVCKWRGVVGKDEQLLREAAASFGLAPDEVKTHMWELPAKFVGPYAEADARATLALYHDLLPILHDEETFPAYRVECDLIPLVLEMRRRGIRIDEEKAYAAKEMLEKKSEQIIKSIGERLGEKVSLDNLRSVAWLERVHDEAKVSYPRTPRTNRGSFQAGKSGWMRDHPHWLPKAIADAERYAEAASKFVDGFILKFMHAGRLHASINQFRNEEGGTRSHRFSYSDPPLQQMPERDSEIGPLIRSLFLPEPGHVWGAHDYSQQEYRIIVHAGSILGKRRAQEAVKLYHENPDMDFHALVVDWTGLDRKRAKDTNFAKAFGAGVPKFALMIGKSKDEAKEIYEQYDREFPFVSESARTCDRLASSRGYIRLIDNSRCHFDLWECSDRSKNYDGMGRYIPPKSKEDAMVQWPGQRLRRAYTHKAFNRFVQGSAARMTKAAMLQCWKEGLVPMLQMHDDLNFSHADSQSGIRVAEIMKTAMELDVPIKVDSEYGISWGDARDGQTYEQAKTKSVVG